jgi:hypothetical protein
MDVKKLIELLSGYPEGSQVRFLSQPGRDRVESSLRGVASDIELIDDDQEEDEENIKYVYIFDHSWHSKNEWPSR